MDKAFKIISRHAEEGAKLRRDFFSVHGSQIADAAKQIAVSVARGSKLLIAGNGGSAADAQHWAGEFVNRFMVDRPPLPAIALTTDSSVITSIGNDFGYEMVFAKQIAALGREGDVLLGISTSGNSENIIAALRTARKLGMLTIGLTGEGGGRMAPLCDILIAVPCPDDVLMKTPLVQEIHAATGHLLCALTDHYLFENVMEIRDFLD